MDGLENNESLHDLNGVLDLNPKVVISDISHSPLKLRISLSSRTVESKHSNESLSVLSVETSPHIGIADAPLSTDMSVRKEVTSKKLLDTLLAVHEKIVKKDPKNYYAEPVTEAIAPNYFSVITHPMDLSTIFNKLTSKSYYETASQYLDDIILMCTNSMLYNPPDTVYYQKARKIMQFAEKLINLPNLNKLRLNLDLYGDLEMSDIGIPRRRIPSPNSIKWNSTTTRNHPSTQAALAQVQRISPLQITQYPTLNLTKENLQVSYLESECVTDSIKCLEATVNNKRKLLFETELEKTPDLPLKRSRKKKHNRKYSLSNLIGSYTKESHTVDLDLTTPRSPDNSQHSSLLEHRSISSFNCDSNLIESDHPLKFKINRQSIEQSPKFDNSPFPETPVGSQLSTNEINSEGVESTKDGIESPVITNVETPTSIPSCVSNQKVKNHLTPAIAKKKPRFPRAHSGVNGSNNESTPVRRFSPRVLVESRLAAACRSANKNRQRLKKCNDTESARSFSWDDETSQSSFGAGLISLDAYSPSANVPVTDDVDEDQHLALELSDKPHENSHISNNQEIGEIDDSNRLWAEDRWNFSDSFTDLQKVYVNLEIDDVKEKLKAEKIIEEAKNAALSIKSFFNDKPPCFVSLNLETSNSGSVKVYSIDKQRKRRVSSSSSEESLNDFTPDNRQEIKLTELANKALATKTGDILVPLDEETQKTLDALNTLRYRREDPISINIHGPLCVFNEEELPRLLDVYGGEAQAVEYALSLLQFCEPLGREARLWAHQRLDSATDGLHRQLATFCKLTSKRKDAPDKTWLENVHLTLDATDIEISKSKCKPAKKLQKMESSFMSLLDSNSPEGLDDQTNGFDESASSEEDVDDDDKNSVIVVETSSDEESQSIDKKDSSNIAKLNGFGEDNPITNGHLSQTNEQSLNSKSDTELSDEVPQVSVKKIESIFHSNDLGENLKESNVENILSNESEVEDIKFDLNKLVSEENVDDVSNIMESNSSNITTTTTRTEIDESNDIKISQDPVSSKDLTDIQSSDNLCIKQSPNQQTTCDEYIDVIGDLNIMNDNSERLENSLYEKVEEIKIEHCENSSSSFMDLIVESEIKVHIKEPIETSVALLNECETFISCEENDSISKSEETSGFQSITTTTLQKKKTSGSKIQDVIEMLRSRAATKSIESPTDFKS